MTVVLITYIEVFHHRYSIAIIAFISNHTDIIFFLHFTLNQIPWNQEQNMKHRIEKLTGQDFISHFVKEEM